MIFKSKDFGTCLGHEGGMLMNGISDLIIQTVVGVLPPLSCHMRHSEKTAMNQQGSMNQEAGPH